MADEEIVMTPTKSGKVTSIKFEKVKRAQIDESRVAHKAGGQHTGLVINKQTAGDTADYGRPDIQLEFKCFLVDNKTGHHIPESRILKFWFVSNTDYLDKVTGAYEFFKELVKPDNFPRDYVGFIKKVMKQMQQPKYNQMKKIDVDLSPLEHTESGPPLSPVGADSDGMKKVDTRPKNVIVQERLLLTLESAYPNVMPVDYLTDLTAAEQTMVQEQLQVLKGRNLIHEMEPGKWVRNVKDDKTEVKVVKQMPIQTSGSRPTVAIITSKYYEKLAVDAMMTEKTTFVKYKTEGESNVYTIGYIGKHKVVSTKLPAIGTQMREQIAAGSTTTRLLGTFSDVEHVLLVGVAGGVPHYTDFYKDVHLGDVIVSSSNDKGYLYVYCDSVQHDHDKGQVQYKLKSWGPHDMIIQKIVDKLWEAHKDNVQFAPWEDYIVDGQHQLQGQEVNFARPPSDTDKLYMNIGGNDVIEVGHPRAPEEINHWYREGTPIVRRGAIASGMPIIRDDHLRVEFAAQHGCIAYDTEFDQVLESIVGNRKDSFAFIRGVVDYLDGTKNKDWQPYSSLVAAAFMKAVIENLPEPDNS